MLFEKIRSIVLRKLYNNDQLSFIQLSMHNIIVLESNKFSVFHNI